MKVKSTWKELALQIGELAERSGASARALRHYEERGLLIPERTNSGYRVYSDDDILRVTQIKTMINAGLSTATVKRYIDCARNGDHGTWLELCTDLRAELSAAAARVDEQQIELREQQRRLRNLTSMQVVA